MSGDQILATALATVPTMVVVLIGILINNARLSDLSARLTDVKDSFRAELHSEIKATRDVLDAKLEALDAKMERNHSEMLHRFGDLDNRLTRLENNLGMGR